MLCPFCNQGLAHGRYISILQPCWMNKFTEGNNQNLLYEAGVSRLGFLTQCSHWPFIISVVSTIHYVAAMVIPSSLFSLYIIRRYWIDTVQFLTFFTWLGGKSLFFVLSLFCSKEEKKSYSQSAAHPRDLDIPEWWAWRARYRITCWLLPPADVGPQAGLCTEHLLALIWELLPTQPPNSRTLRKWSFWSFVQVPGPDLSHLQIEMV